MTPKKNKEYSKEFKLETIRLANESDKPVMNDNRVGEHRFYT